MINTKIRNHVTNTGIRNPSVNVRVSSYQTGILTPLVTNSIPIGTPIGLLLSLTYASVVTVVVSSMVFIGDGRPNVRITNN